ncbi:alpha/beta fold hydrolase [Pseudoruegeria sp. HB172150]|uniref:bifunctional alpha/beta hydrolase/OsmC family protein n=1 Tax=Pseudoruegeria sp. HB172150 TaxID=2721164 RepID=UPI0015522EAC|nr:alpha/beta fold hydrolase [Pseudoruegeria sp. HB172150]
MPTAPVFFDGPSGETLSARFDLPEGPTLVTALFAHCFTCGKDNPAARRISQRLAAMGIAVLRFDFAGLGDSEGDFEETTFASNVGELVAAAEYLTGRGMAPALLIGHSLGGAAVVCAAGQIASVKAVTVIGAPFDPASIVRHFEDAMPKIASEGVAEVSLGGRTVRVGRHFVEDVQEANIEAALAELKRALLVLHAPRDAVVGIENAARIFGAAKHPKSFVTLDNADHLVSRAEDAEYAAGVISAWAGKYLELHPPAPPPGAPEGIVRVSEADADGFLQDVSHGPWHHTVADEPEAYGGTNRGMSPYGFVAAGLGACTSMTIRMYARRKDWPLQHVRVDVSHSKVHAQDVGDASSPKVDRFRREIALEGSLSGTQRAKLLAIADRCPVHRTLEAEAVIETVLVKPG